LGVRGRESASSRVVVQLINRHVVWALVGHGHCRVCVRELGDSH
jgi:hypothetical protein